MPPSTDDEDFCTQEETLAKWGFDKDYCMRCQKSNEEIAGLLMQCGKCKKVYYCSLKCFNDDLPTHQKICGTAEFSHKEPDRITASKSVTAECTSPPKAGKKKKKSKSKESDNKSSKKTVTKKKKKGKKIKKKAREKDEAGKGGDASNAVGEEGESTEKDAPYERVPKEDKIKSDDIDGSDLKGTNKDVKTETSESTEHVDSQSLGDTKADGSDVLGDKAITDCGEPLTEEPSCNETDPDCTSDMSTDLPGLEGHAAKYSMGDDECSDDDEEEGRKTMGRSTVQDESEFGPRIGHNFTVGVDYAEADAEVRGLIAAMELEEQEKKMLLAKVQESLAAVNVSGDKDRPWEKSQPIWVKAKELGLLRKTELVKQSPGGSGDDDSSALENSYEHEILRMLTETYSNLSSVKVNEDREDRPWEKKKPVWATEKAAELLRKTKQQRNTDREAGESSEASQSVSDPCGTIEKCVNDEQFDVNTDGLGVASVHDPKPEQHESEAKASFERRRSLSPIKTTSRDQNDRPWEKNKPVWASEKVTGLLRRTSHLPKGDFYTGESSADHESDPSFSVEAATTSSTPGTTTTNGESERIENDALSHGGWEQKTSGDSPPLVKANKNTDERPWEQQKPVWARAKEAWLLRSAKQNSKGADDSGESSTSRGSDSCLDCTTDVASDTDSNSGIACADPSSRARNVAQKPPCKRDAKMTLARKYSSLSTIGIIEEDIEDQPWQQKKPVWARKRDQSGLLRKTVHGQKLVVGQNALTSTSMH